MKKMFKKICSVFMFAFMLVAYLPASKAFAADGTIKKLTDVGVTGGTVYLYKPANITTNALMSPIVILYGQKAYVDESEAQAALVLSGIKAQADKDGFYVYMPTMTNGSTWDAANDVKVYQAIVDNTTNAGYAPDGMSNGRYAGDLSLINLIGEGSGADFINSNLLNTFTSPKNYNSSYVPAAVLTFNATNEPVSNLEIPAFIVNGTSSAVNKYKEMNKTDINSVSNGINIYSNKSQPVQKVMSTTSAVTNGYDTSLTQKAYDMLFSTIRRRNLGFSGDGSLQLYERPNYSALGLTVNAHVEEYVQEAGARKHTWYEYIPEGVKNSDKKVPLILIFHGGGNHALFEAETSGFPEIAAKEGFIVVSVQHSGSAIENETPESVITLLKYLETKLPIDTTRVYASGFSMGSDMTQNLGLKYPEYFAAIAPMDGSFGTLSEKTLVVPTIYFAGEKSPLRELPHQASWNNGAENEVDTFIKGLCAINGVNYTGFDSQYGLWGIKADKTYSVTSKSGVNLISVSELNSTKDGIGYTALAATSNKGHSILPEEGQVAWDFLKKFSRQTDGSIKLVATSNTDTTQNNNTSSNQGSTTNNSTTTTTTTTTTATSPKTGDAGNMIAVLGLVSSCAGIGIMKIRKKN